MYATQVLSNFITLPDTMSQVREPPDEHLQIYDPMTNGVIHCVNHGLCKHDGWCEQYLHGVPCRINVVKDESSDDGMTFEHDDYVSQKI